MTISVIRLGERKFFLMQQVTMNSESLLYSVSIVTMGETNMINRAHKNRFTIILTQNVGKIDILMISVQISYFLAIFFK